MADVGLTEGGERTAVGPGRAPRPPWPERLRRVPEWSRRHPRVLWAAGLAAAALVLYWCYLRQAQTLELDADPAAQALQAWQMWHGNLLLSGWWLGDMSFYTVELPLNAFIEMVYGLRPGEVHILAALLYTAVVLLGALLARGNARGSVGVVRALLAAGIMLAPSLQVRDANPAARTEPHRHGGSDPGAAAGAGPGPGGAVVGAGGGGRDAGLGAGQ